MSKPSVSKPDASFYASILPWPSRDANKYSRGTVGVVGGSRAYPGAPIMAANACARSGAGYVRLVVPEGAASCAHAHLLSIPVTGCPQSDAGVFCEDSIDEAIAALDKSDVLLIGPGMGTTADAEAFLRGIACNRPIVFDADALTIIARSPELLCSPARNSRVLTPHEGEAQRLLGRAIVNRREDAHAIAKIFDSVVLLKGPETLVVTPDGDMRCVAEGGPELAKAGTGDVLGGMIAAFMCQGLDAFDAASLAAFVHGRAGRHAARELSVQAVMPEDIISSIGPTFLSLES